MKRRTLLLGGVAVGVGSLTATATKASINADMSLSGDLRGVVPAVETNIDTDPSDENTLSTHTWEFDFIRIDEVVTDLSVEYPDGTSFDEVTNNEVTIKFENDDGDLVNIAIKDSNYDKTVATFELDTEQKIFESAKIEIEQIENPDAGMYNAETTFVTDSEENTATGELNITSD